MSASNSTEIKKLRMGQVVKDVHLKLANQNSIGVSMAKCVRSLKNLRSS